MAEAAEAAASGGEPSGQGSPKCSRPNLACEADDQGEVTPPGEPPEPDDGHCNAGGATIARQHRYLQWRLVLYSVSCFAATMSFSALTFALWSDMGCSLTCVDFLRDKDRYAKYCALAFIAVLLVLYLLDFFIPSHLPGRYCVLTNGNGCLGRGCLLVAVLAMLAWAFLLAKDFPTLPFVVTNMACPLSVVLVRRITMPVLPEWPQGLDSRRGLEDRIALIKLLTWEERDERNFYVAALCSFLAAGVSCMIAWAPWAVAQESKFNEQMATITDQGDRELLFIRWAAPVLVALSDFVFAAFAGLRVRLHGAYSATDPVKNQLLVEANKEQHRAAVHYRIARLRARVASARSSADLRTAEDRLQKHLVQHITHLRRLSKTVKSLGFAIVALLLVLHIVFQMVTEVSHSAIMVEGLLISFLGAFIVSIFVSFNRVSRSMTVELMDMQVIRNIYACSEAAWARALLICFTLPLVPIFLALSCLNQLVRRQRGLPVTSGLLTRRVDDFFHGMLAWSWMEVVGWCYTIAGVIIIFRIAPTALNVLLAWAGSSLADLSFWATCSVVFGIGMFLTMLPPPVPPAIIFPFAGILISDPEKCPFGFWWGMAISATLAYVLRHVSNVVQQKCIGEYLGSSSAVRRAVGIHKPAVRAIENILKRPGFSVGKCMILCGGPDWPTSVLCGILGLSVWPVTLGTIPVIASVVPMTLTGSFYLMREQSEVWLRTGNLMLFLTSVVSGVFMTGIGWALQSEFDCRGAELRRPREEDVELEWLDHQSRFVAERCKVEWHEVPRIVSWTFAAGAVALIFTQHLFLWCARLCWSAFSLTDDIASVRWFGHGALIRPAGIVGFSAIAAGYLAFAWYHCWRRTSNRSLVAEALEELREQEPVWKERWLQDARAAAAADQVSVSASPTRASTRLPVGGCAGEEAECPESNASGSPRFQASPGACPSEGAVCSDDEELLCTFGTQLTIEM